MCGIAGFLAYGREESGALLRTMIAPIAHRGPDGTETEEFELGPGVRVGLAHARLALFDPSVAGAQPMRKGDLALVLNGSIVNHPEVRVSLEREGVRFRSRTDTEVLLEAWRARGDAALAGLTGAFAFAIADLRRRELILGRDRLGEKPLYLAEIPGALLFSSELAAIEAHPSFRREIDPGALRAYLALGWIPWPRSIYRRVTKVPPGTTVRLGPEGARAPEPYWTSPRWTSAADREGEEAPAEALEGVLADAVRLRLRADVPVGIFLSGGIDSSLVAALAREAAGSTPPTFTFACPGHPEDESDAARRVARHLNAEHHEVSLRSDEALEVAEDVLGNGIDEPLGDYSSIPTTFLARRAGRSVRVVLTGDGGDELFAGYDRYRALRWISRLGPAPLRRLAAAAAAVPRTRRALALARALRAGDAVERALAFHGGFEKAEIEALAGPGPVPLGEFGLAHSAAGDPAENAMQADLRAYLVDDLLAKVDRATMRAALEARAPFLDHRVVEFARRGGGRLGPAGPKALLRRILARRFPAAWFARPKQGFTVPLSDWLRGALRPLAERLLDPARFPAGGGLASEPASRIARLHLDGRVDRPSAVWSLLVFQSWRERTGAFVGETPAPGRSPARTRGD